MVTLVKTTRFCSGRGVKRGRKQNDEYFGIELGRERNRRKMEKTFKGKRLGDRKKERERRKSKKESKNVGIDKRKENVQVNRKERTIDTQRETNKKNGQPVVVHLVERSLPIPGTRGSNQVIC